MGTITGVTGHPLFISDGMACDCCESTECPGHSKWRSAQLPEYTGRKVSISLLRYTTDF